MIMQESDFEDYNLQNSDSECMAVVIGLHAVAQAIDISQGGPVVAKATI